MRPVTVHDYEHLAAEALPADVHGYYAGGSEDERTLRDNVAAWERWKLRPRVLDDSVNSMPRALATAFAFTSVTVSFKIA